MKNIPFFHPLVSGFVRKPRFLPLLLLLLCPRSLAAGENPYGLTLSNSAGFLYGRGEEIVYKYPEKDAFLSQLLWDLKPLFYAGAGLELAKTRPPEGPALLAKLSLQFGIPAPTGILEDRDWDNPREDFLTHYSRHDAYADAMIFLDLRGGLSMPLFSRLRLKTFLGFSFLRLKWTGRDGYIQYPPESGLPWTGGLEKKAVSGPGIVYTQNWLFFFPGIAAGADIGEFFSWEVSAALSPLVYGTAQDDHLLTGSLFTDYFNKNITGGFFWESRGAVSFSPREGLELELYLAGKSVRSQRGNSSWTSSGINSRALPSQETAGAGVLFIDLGLSVKVVL